MRLSKSTTGSIKINKTYQAEPLERMIAKQMTSKAPIDMSAPKIYTEAKEGVRPENDIRTDRWEVAQEAMTKIAKSKKAKTAANPKEKVAEPSQSADASE